MSGTAGGDKNKIAISGQPLGIPATVWNEMLEGLQWIRGQRARSGEGSVRPDPRNTGIVLIRNDSGADRAQFDILGIEDFVFQPSENIVAFCETPAFSGVVPQGEHQGKFVVLMEPILAGGIGRAIVSGMAVVRIEFDDDGDEWCDVLRTDATKLKSGISGAAKILHYEAGSNPRWAVIKIAAGSTRTGGGSIGSPAHIRKMTLNGDQVWAFAHATAGYGVTEMAVGNDTLVAIMGNNNGYMWLVDPENGDLLKLIHVTGGGTFRARVTVDDTNIVAQTGNSSFDVIGYDGIVIAANPTATAANNLGIKIGPDGKIWASTGAAVKSYTIGSSTAIRTITFTATVYDIAFDSSGNVIFALANNAGTEVRCYDPSGSLLWGYEHGSHVFALAVDSNDNILIGGGQGAGAKTTRLLDSSGSVIWSANHGYGLVVDVAFDAYGNCYTTGDLVGVNPGGGVGTSRIATQCTTRKYDPSGSLVWSYNWGAQTFAIEVIDGFLYVAGNLSSYYTPAV